MKLANALLLTPLLALTLVACDSKKPADENVAKAAEIAKEIKATPADAEKILAKHKMSVDEFEALMIDIAADETKSDAFEKAGS